MHPILDLREEMDACNADAYKVLNEWGMEGRERVRYIDYLKALARAISRAQSEAMKSKSKG